ncbi:carboxynorspermidine decarboxylase [Anaerotignum propionicum]|uniref:carboxynorspermidine decarboxylase n=1 Tax=Anaerotignum propionicum TaxID=28446 RepID=UPI002108DE24|nr:carboxynorspermidine decarboxylase [Anaerotignum propionicum]MCQ4935926.1 carboxynorspermidine decarboxylase [Anaerotignum propionicum]
MVERLYSVETPCYVVNEKRLIENLEILKDVAIRAGCKILLAQKAFSMFSVYPLIGRYLDGTTASGLFEAKLGYEEMGKETHVFSAAYMEKEFDEITRICDHISFNSFAQWQKYGKKALERGRSCGIRINPQHSTQEHGIYDPCAEGSRLGVTRENFRPELLEGIEGLHFHTLCEQNSDALIDTLVAVEEKFGEFLPRMKWVNFGGGHHITREDYDREALIECILRFKEKYQVEVYLEPGEAIALNAGYLVSSVLDIVHNGIDIALLDASAACHMPDVIEMPYRPPLWQGGEPKEKPHTYRLAGATCLAGDVIGDYSFTQPLSVGDKLIFMDMAIYSMVKNNTFNGMCLPSIAVLQENGELNIIRKFGYEDFKGRLS